MIVYRYRFVTEKLTNKLFADYLKISNATYDCKCVKIINKKKQIDGIVIKETQISGCFFLERG